MAIWCIATITMVACFAAFGWMTLFLLADRHGISLENFLGENSVRKIVFGVTMVTMICLPLLLFLVSKSADYMAARFLQ